MVSGRAHPPARSLLTQGRDWQPPTLVKIVPPGVDPVRWPVEQIPLAAKHMLAAHLQFVFAQVSIQRLPELALLAGSIQSFLAVTLSVTATGFWDRNPRRTPGRLRRVLFGQLFPSSYPLAERIRKKGSAPVHLPKGILGHRRSAMPT